MDSHSLEIRGPRTRREVKALADLYGKAFRGYGHHYRLYLRNVLDALPCEQWRLSRALWRPDGTPVAQVRVCDRTMRLGAAWVRVGGIGDVCTHPFHRGQNHMRRLFGHVLEFLHEEGYGLSLLWGIPRFYDKFGFIAALSQDTVQMPREQAERLEGPYRGRRARSADAPAIARHFRADLARRDGAMQRPDARWPGRTARKKGTRVLADAQGRVRAYYRAGPDDDAVILSEVSLGRRPKAPLIRSLLADMARQAKRHEKPSLRLDLPASHPIGQFCVADGCEIRRHIGHRGGAMARIANLEVLCASLAPEWERGLAASALAGWSGRLRLRVSDPTEPQGGGGGTWDLAIREGTVRPEPPEGRARAVLTADQDKLCRLVLGFHGADAARFLGEVKLTHAAEPLAAALFPPRALAIFPADRF